MKVSYVVLHYKTIQDTFACVDSILNQQSKHQIKIVIVDNGSGDESGEEIHKKYEEVENVVTIVNGENLGFACGNNTGYQYAKYTEKSDFIILLNNDTILAESDFTNKLIDIYEQEKYYVLGPDTVDENEGHLNPAGKYILTLKGAIHFRKSCKYVVDTISADPEAYRKKRSASSKPKFREKTEEKVENCLLHGACFIFSPDYVKKFDGLYEKTFLYMEEDCLKLQMDYYRYKMLYSPDLSLIHKGSSSTKEETKDEVDRIKKKHMHLIDSSKAYISLILKLKCKPSYIPRWIKNHIK